MITVQEVLQTLNEFWASRGCILWQPYHTEVGAGTSNPATFLRVLGPEPWWVAYPEPSIRPTDGRYGENPNRLQHYYQYQVILKPSPPNVQELYLQSLEALGLDLTRHDYRFVEDNWQSPSLGAWGLGWEAWLDGMEILQFTYFQECGGLKLDVRACELTYGIERIAMYLQGVESVYDLKWAPSGITYGDIYHASEVEWCKYNFEAADTGKLLHVFDLWEAEAARLLELGLIMPAYDHCLRLSHLFNLLDARGALSVTERGRFLLRCRAVAERCARGFFEQRQEKGFPLCRLPRPGAQADSTPLQAVPGAFQERDTLLLEIGVEELPHSDVKAVRAQLPALLDKLLQEERLDHGPVTVWVTPRRIVARIDDCASHQQDLVEEARGPARKAAQDAEGHWTVPARKFAESRGASVEDIYFQEQGKAEYCFVKVERKGRHITELLSGIVAKLIGGLQFVKSMGWEDSTVAFSRPIRWLLALHGANPVPVTWKFVEGGEFAAERSLHSGAVSYGHRRLAAGPVHIPSAAGYLAEMKRHFVLPVREERMARLRGEAEKIASAQGLHLEEDDELFEEIIDITEWPEPILCSIPEDALVLPEEIVITPMKVYQRYIPLRDARGGLSKHFLAIANGEHDEEGRATIRRGNERVLNARLRDARYFWDTDTRKPLREFAAGLSRVLFHQKLGSVADKIARLHKLYAALKGVLPPVDDEPMAQVLDLMKADLTTQMVFEFDSLEGVVGMLYARKEGLPEAIARALFEHRLPRRAGDSLPKTPLGIAAAVLDRIDTLAGYFGIGVRVKGTSDPFGLRRNTLALLSLVQEEGLDLDLEDAFRSALTVYGETLSEPGAAVEAFLQFAADRLAVINREQGIPYDQVAAAIAAHGRRPVQVRRCLTALGRLNEQHVQLLAEQTKRIQRIALDPAPAIDPALLEDNEKALHALTGKPGAAVRDLVARGAFDDAFFEVLSWMPVIEAYFEAVFVNHEDARMRQNRHALLKAVFNAITAVADLTLIEKKETPAE